MKMVPLGDIADLDSGAAFKANNFNTNDAGLPVVRIRDVTRGYSTTYYSGAYEDKHLVQNDDYLIGMDGEFNLGQWRGGLALLNQRVCRISARSSSVDIGYLVRLLRLELKKIENRTSFATVKHLSAKTLRTLEVPLPPLDEQRRIAAILDKADAIRQKRRQAIAHLDTLAQSIFHEMFRDHEDFVELQSVCSKITDGTHQSPQWVDSGIPFLFVSNITSGEINFSTRKFISEGTWSELTRRTPIDGGDVLYSTVGSFGIPAVVRTTSRFAFQRHIAHIKPVAEKIESDFLSAQLASTVVLRQAERAARGIAQPTINLADIRRFSIIAPPIEEQRRFSSLTTRIRTQKRTLHQSAQELDQLFKSLQSRAFRGEL